MTKEFTEIRERLARIEQHLIDINGKVLDCPRKHEEINKFMGRANTNFKIMFAFYTTLIASMAYIIFR